MGVKTTERAIVIPWEKLRSALPLIQAGNNTEPLRPPFISEVEFGFNQNSEKFELTVSRYARPTAKAETDDVEKLKADLNTFFLNYYQGTLDAAINKAVYNTILEMLMQIPYPQDCLCQGASRGLMANDCHVHTENPRHFFGDFDFTCTCTQKGE